VIEPEPKGWRKWMTLTAAQIALSGFLLMSYGLGRLLRANAQVDASVKGLDSSVRGVGEIQEQGSKRIAGQTQTLITWTKLLFGVTVILCVLTVVLLVASTLQRQP
jgi:hypothetical protein